MTPETQRKLQSVGNYDLLAKIAEGGMGAVYKGRHKTTGLIVAIKIVPADTAKNALLLKRFEQEFKAASLIDHPNVVKALDYCGTGPTPFLVMEFVDGESLGQMVERVGSLTEAEAVRLINQVCEGLHRAHKQGLIHRDVKPDNVMVTKDGVAKLTDLGLVKDVEGEMNLTKTGRGLGTPHFMAPEQFRNAKSADVRCDVYSLGATLYMLVTGEIPFAKTSPLDCWMKKVKNDFPEPRSINSNISERTNWAIKRAMSADPTQRPASCREFMEDLTGSGWRTAAGNSGTTGPAKPTNPVDDIWYVVYRDSANARHTVKGTTDSIRKNVQSGSLGAMPTILVSRSKTGQFVPLRNVPEFRDLVVSPAPSGTFPAPKPAAKAEPGGASGTKLPQPAGPQPARTPGANPDFQSLSGRVKVPEGPTEQYVPAADSGEHPASKPKFLTSRHKPLKESKFDWRPIALIALIAAGIGIAVAVFLR